jgi:hypothetical protein
VRQSFELRTLRERAVSHVDLDRHERDAAILDRDDLETVRQNLALNSSLQFGALAEQW